MLLKKIKKYVHLFYYNKKDRTPKSYQAGMDLLSGLVTKWEYIQLVGDDQGYTGQLARVGHVDYVVVCNPITLPINKKSNMNLPILTMPRVDIMVILQKC